MTAPGETADATSATPETVAFMCGAGHSGSTLLGLMLGAHPRVFYAGEAKKSLLLGDESKPPKKRQCKVCGEPCPIWSRVPPADPDVHATLARLTGRSVVVDSSKDVGWIETRAAALRARGVATRLFFVVRDGRAVVGSRLRKYPETSVEDHARAWVAQIEAATALARRFPGGAHVARYEALATRPEEQIRAAAAHLGLVASPDMLEPWRFEQHPIGGNSGTQSLLRRVRAAAEAAPPPPHDRADAPTPAAREPGVSARAYYAEHPQAIVLDERWRRELAPDVLERLLRILGETNDHLPGAP